MELTTEQQINQAIDNISTDLKELPLYIVLKVENFVKCLKEDNKEQRIKYAISRLAEIKEDKENNKVDSKYLEMYADEIKECEAILKEYAAIK